MPNSSSQWTSYASSSDRVWTAFVDRMRIVVVVIVVVGGGGDAAHGDDGDNVVGGCGG